MAGAPVFLTRLIGRDEAVTEVAELIDRARVVTLIGAGGVGKTRLAVEVVSRLDRPWTFVDLAAVTDDAHVVTAVARALGIGGRTADESAVLNRLAGDSRVLVVDNAEHVVVAVAAVVAKILVRAPQVSVLVTSRRPLALDGEVLWRVPPLDEAEAAALFADRARACGRSVAESPEDREVVDAICRRLDGIPLAIELVAARCRAFALHDLAEQVATALTSLPDSRRGQPDRRRTIDASVDWSWRQLSEEEQGVLAALAVFPATFTLDAARAVGRTNDETLLALVDHSLMHLEDTRYRLYDVVREFAQARAQEDAHDRLVDWCVAHLATPVSTAPEELDAVDRDLPTYRAAMRWSLDHARALDGIRVAVALGQYWETRDTAEGISWLVPLRDAVPETCRERALAARAISHCVFFRGDFPLTKAMESEAAQYARAAGDDALLGAATKGMGWAARAMFDPEAGGHFAASIEPLRAAGDIPSLVDAILGVAETAWADGDIATARTAVEEGLAEARAGDPATLLQALLFVSFGAYLDGDLDHVAAVIDEALPIGRALRDELWLPAIESLEARLLADGGDAAGAVARLAALVERSEASGNIVGLAIAWWAKGFAAFDEQQLETAGRVALLTGFPYLSADLAAARARVAIVAGNLDEAATVCDEALTTAGMPFGGYGRPPALLARSELAQARNEYSDALNLAYEALELAVTGKCRRHTAAAVARIAQVRSETGDADAARLLAAQPLDDAVALAQRGRGRRGRPSAGWESLTPTERDIVDLVCSGLTNPEIAAKLFVAPATVKTHLSNVFAKLGVKNRAELAAHASSREG